VIGIEARTPSIPTTFRASLVVISGGDGQILDVGPLETSVGVSANRGQPIVFFIDGHGGGWGNVRAGTVDGHLAPSVDARVNREIRELIRCMSRENSIWGAPRILSELLLLTHRPALLKGWPNSTAGASRSTNSKNAVCGTPPWQPESSKGPVG
jgi:hypothetical protein